MIARFMSFYKPGVTLVEYEAVRKGMELLLEAGAEAVEIFGDSQLVISQLTEEYRCESGPDPSFD